MYQVYAMLHVFLIVLEWILCKLFSQLEYLYRDFLTKCFLLQCHFSYSACGLGSNGTDRLVSLVQEMQHSEGGTLFGAKITGGGSGGTVCVIGRNCLRSNEQLIEVPFYSFIIVIQSLFALL